MYSFCTFSSSTSTPGASPATSLWKTETFTIPADQNGRNGAKVHLQNLYMYRNFAPIYKSAFSKGLFPGGKEAYKVISVLDRLEHPSFIDMLLNLKDPAKSCELFLKYFNGNYNKLDVPKIIKSIDEIGNDEKIIEQALPLLKLFESYLKLLLTFFLPFFLQSG